MLAMTETIEATGDKENVFDKRMHAGLRNKENVVLDMRVLDAARSKENMALDKRVLEVVSNKENIPPPNSPTVHRRRDRKRTPLADISAADLTCGDKSQGTTPKRTFVIYDTHVAPKPREKGPSFSRIQQTTTRKASLLR